MIGGSATEGEVPFWQCDQSDVVDAVGYAPYFAMDIQVYPNAGEKQPGSGSLRTQ